MSGLNRIERWSSNVNAIIEESDDISGLTHITKLRSTPIAYGLDLLLYTKKDCKDAITLLTKISDTLPDD
jgi:hypothetical protein